MNFWKTLRLLSGKLFHIKAKAAEGEQQNSSNSLQKVVWRLKISPFVRKFSAPFVGPKSERTYPQAQHPERGGLAGCTTHWTTRAASWKAIIKVKNNKTKWSFNHGRSSRQRILEHHKMIGKQDMYVKPKSFSLHAMKRLLPMLNQTVWV